MGAGQGEAKSQRSEHDGFGGPRRTCPTGPLGASIGFVATVSSLWAPFAPLGAQVTYAQDVAPLIARECLGCHVEGGIAPFTLATYHDVRAQAERIARATGSRAMPPWLPDSEPGVFAGERRLSEGEIETLRRWVEQGAQAGDLDELEELEPEPQWSPGEPDLIVDLPEYTVPAEGEDVYRNLVVPIPVEETRWVEYVELKPGSRSVVHHARMMVDTSSSSRALAGGDGLPGFDGMELRSEATDPDGHFVGWTPGKSRLPPIEGTAWRLDPGTDLVVQLHLRASGAEEVVRAQVELHFAERPPTRRPAVLVVSTLQIDIPPGEPDYRVTNSFTLPVDVEVLSVYPHAHYLGKELSATAVLPNGREVELIHIPDWDFNWQDDYRFARPIPLPRGTTILKEFSFDNSAANPHNPSDPPRRVVYGSGSDDEMADLILQVLPRSESDRETLLQAQAWQHESEDMAYMARSEYVRGKEALDAGRLEAATRHFQEALQYRADHVGSLVSLSRIFELRGDAESALVIARQAVLVSNRQDASALDRLSGALAVLGQTAEALDVAEDALGIARGSGDDELVRAIEQRIRWLRG